MPGKRRREEKVETGTGTQETTYQDRDATRKKKSFRTSKAYLSVLSQSAGIKKTAEEQGKPLFKCDLLIMPDGASPGGT